MKAKRINENKIIDGEKEILYFIFFIHFDISVTF